MSAAEDATEVPHPRATTALYGHVEAEQAFLEAYRELAANEPGRCIVIDADESRHVIAEKIWTIVNERFDPATAPLMIEGAR